MAVKKTRENGIGRGKAGPGRPRGLANKLTRSAKQAFEHAFEQLGGTDALTKWAKDNPSDFYRLYARLIPKPLEVTGPEGGPVEIVAAPKFTDPKEFAAWVRGELQLSRRKSS